MSLLFNLGLTRKRIIHEVSRGGLVGQVVEVAEGKDRWHAILLLRGRSREVYCELRFYEWETNSFLIGSCFAYLKQLVGGDIAASLAEKELPPE